MDSYAQENHMPNMKPKYRYLQKYRYRYRYIDKILLNDILHKNV